MDLHSSILLAETCFEAAGVAVLIIGSLVALARFAADLVSRRAVFGRAYLTLRQSLARAIVLGLEFLVAADIIRSVALAPSFQSVGVLGLIVVVRTFLSWSLEVEITGEWPWHRARRAGGATEDANGL